MYFHTLVIPPSLTLFMKSKLWAEGKSFVNNPPLYEWKFVNCSIPPSTDQHSCKIYFMRSQVSTEGGGGVFTTTDFWNIIEVFQHWLVKLSINYWMFRSGRCIIISNYFPRKTFHVVLEQPWCIGQIMPKITQIALNNIKGTKNKVTLENTSFRNVK